jgi:16S rRNA (uracil1498-N3)-methyltransferase
MPRERCYCPEPPIAGRLVLTGDEAHHLARVRRVGAGTLVEVFDGVNPMAWPARVVASSPREVELEIDGEPIVGREPAVALTLAVALPKGDRVDWLVEKAVEVGVSRLVPLRTERSVVDPRDAKLDRLRRRVVEASKQCGRNRLMEVAAPIAWDAFRGGVAGGAARLIAHPAGVEPGAWPSLERDRSRLLAVGPEGGWSDAEVEAAVDDGWTPVGLGPILMRIETAALVGAALVLLGARA